MCTIISIDITHNHGIAVLDRSFSFSFVWQHMLWNRCVKRAFRAGSPLGVHVSLSWNKGTCSDLLTVFFPQFPPLTLMMIQRTCCARTIAVLFLGPDRSLRIDDVTEDALLPHRCFRTFDSCPSALLCVPRFLQPGDVAEDAPPLHHRYGIFTLDGLLRDNSAPPHLFPSLSQSVSRSDQLPSSFTASVPAAACVCAHECSEQDGL